MIKVFTKGAALNCLFQITIRCGDDSHIDGDGLIPAHAFELSLLEKSEKLGLELLGDIAHLVQENGAPVRRFHLASFELLCAGESAFLRSEEHTSELQSPYDLVCRLLLE